MSRTIARAAAALLSAGVLVAGTVAVSAPADAASADSRTRAHITAHPSDSTVDSGEQFIVRGRFTVDGHAAGGRTVKIQQLVGDDWRAVEGAHVRSQGDGTYRVRVILFTEGNRVLRSVGEAPGGLRNAYNRFGVVVG